MALVFQNCMGSSLLGLITAVSIIINGSSKHFIKGDYQEKNEIHGVEISTTIEDPISRQIGIKDSETSFYYKKFINSFDQPSETIGANVKWFKFDSPFLKIDMGYTLGLVKGYDPPIIYQDGTNIIKAEIAPYLMGWTNISIRPLPKTRFEPITIGTDINCALTACGVQYKVNWDFKF